MWAHAAGCTRSGAQLLTVRTRQTVNLPAQRCGRPCRPACRQVRVRAEKPTGSGGENFHEPEELNLAPVKPKSPVGEMLAYYFKAQPHLFKDAIKQQLVRLRDERDERETQQAAADAEKQDSAAPTSSMDITLYRRMEEVQQSENRATLEDLMYASVLEKFLEMGVDMLASMDAITEDRTTLKSLTEGIHSKEALDTVKEHVANVMGPSSMAYSNTRLKMSKLQAAQVYSASILFGYFVRRVDARFQLERSMGMLPQDSGAGKDNAVSRLERLFAQTDDIDVSNQPAEDGAAQAPPSEAGGAAAGAEEVKDSARPERKGVLREYIESFDQQTLQETARLVSAEGAALVETQSSALFGDVTTLARQMQEAIGQDATSLEEVMQRVQEAVETEKVEVMTVTVGTQRRAVLEAIAFGSFLRDIETHIDSEYRLLTPSTSGGGSSGGSGGGGGGGGGGDGGGSRRGGGGGGGGGSKVSIV